MMKIMCDTNIVLDVLLDREPFADTSAEILSLCEQRKLEGYISASCITDIFYLVKKYLHSNEQAYDAVGKILELLKITSVTNNDVLLAYQARAKDFEDCLVATCAKNNGCECIITRNKKDFEGFEIQVSEPSEFLIALNKGK